MRLRNGEPLYIAGCIVYRYIPTNQLQGIQPVRDPNLDCKWQGKSIAVWLSPKASINRSRAFSEKCNLVFHYLMRKHPVSWHTDLVLHPDIICEMNRPTERTLQTLFYGHSNVFVKAGRAGSGSEDPPQWRKPPEWNIGRLLELDCVWLSPCFLVQKTTAIQQPPLCQLVPLAPKVPSDEEPPVGASRILLPVMVHCAMLSCGTQEEWYTVRQLCSLYQPFQIC